MPDTVQLVPCPGCGVQPSKRHLPGCGNETCAQCGRLWTACFLVAGALDDARAKLVPDFVPVGTVVCAATKLPGGDRYVAWRGEVTGLQEAREFGFWCYDHPTLGAVVCRSDYLGSRPDVVRMMRACRWDAVEQRWVQ